MSDSNACDKSQLSIWLNLMEFGQYSANIACERRQYFHTKKTKKFPLRLPRHI